MANTVERAWLSWALTQPEWVVVGSGVVLVIALALIVWRFGHADAPGDSDLRADDWLAEGGMLPDGKRW